MRTKYPRLTLKYPGCTPIKKCLLSYSLAKNSSVVGSTAQIYQFPIAVCFATTTHKFQGGTVAKPNTVAEDLRTVFEDAAAYVILSRVQALGQLFIINSIPVEKIRTSRKCLAEVERLESISLNKNPPIREQDLPQSVKISCLNCHSLHDKFEILSVIPHYVSVI